jgi:2,4-dienoyl-CoA reductase-like NADH-dependent reductase (Old Yellow Enzyme family)
MTHTDKAEPAEAEQPEAEPEVVEQPEVEPAKAKQPEPEPARAKQPEAEPAKAKQPEAEPAKAKPPNQQRSRPRHFDPATLGDLRLRNRIWRTAAFEGMCQGGEPTAPLLEHHRAMAAGGASLTTVAYCSVSPEGRTYGHQLWMRPEVVPALRRLTDAVHAEGAAAAIQLGHAGYFASKKAIGTRPLGASRVYCLYGMSYPRVMQEADIEKTVADFVRAAELSREAGFDAVELHLGHGYLLSQFLSPYTNRRTDRWGGALDNRLRFALTVLRRVRDALPAGMPVIPKVNLQDGFEQGLQLHEAVEAARRYEEAGATALILSGGFVSKTPFFMLRGKLPTREMARVQPGWGRRVGLRLFGRVFVQEYPFEELFFLEDARRVREAVSLPLVLVGGVCSVDGLRAAQQEGFEHVALGRALIRDPAFPRRLERGESAASDCDHCNRCIAEMDRGGVRCVCRDEGR